MTLRRKHTSVARALLFLLGLDTAGLLNAPPLAASPPQSTAAATPPTTGSPASCADALEEGRAPRVSVAKTKLWPPNHRLVDVGLSAQETSVCDGLVSMRITVWSDEPDEDTGDGSEPIDARLDAGDLYLRSERRGSGDGRVYLIAVTATGEGATGVACAASYVPHSQSASSNASAKAQAATDHCEQTGTAPASFHLLLEGELLRVNLPPVVQAGADQTFELGSAATLDGTVTDDGLPSGTLLVSWSVVSGPGAVTFSSPTNPDTQARFGAAGMYTLRLLASDGALQRSDDVNVVVVQSNLAPVVAAGPDQVVTLPVVTASLAGSATDDGRPAGLLTTTWSQVSGPAGVTFANPALPATTATFPGPGEYVLRLRVDDTALFAVDDVKITVDVEAPPVLTIADAVTDEGQDGATGSLVALSLSKPWPRAVTVDYITEDGTANALCDYRQRYGEVRLEPGQTEAAILVPVIGELVPEADETVRIRLANVAEATLGRETGTLTIRSDDTANQPPSRAAARVPADGTTGTALPPVLTWTASDPDAGDTLTYDVQLGPTFDTGGQVWTGQCAASPTPSPRSAAIAAYDDSSDRMMVYGGAGAESDGLFLLDRATATTGAPVWSAIAVSGGPSGVQRAVSGYDPGTNRLVVHGGCTEGCEAGSAETWVLLHANGLGGVPTWTPVAATGPAPRFGHAGAYDSRSNRLFIFGGRPLAAGAPLADAWMLENANGLGGPPRWTSIDPAGEGPPARHGAGAAYDAARDRLVVFGGAAGDGDAKDDLWALENATGLSGTPQWRALVPAGTPPPARSGHSTHWEPVSRRLLVYGGTTGGIETNRNFVFGDLWMLAEDEPGLTWTRLDPSGGIPRPRFDAATAYAATSNRLLVFSGANNKVGPPGEFLLLSDAMGSLPVVSSGQAETSLTPAGLLPGETYYWRVVTRDSHGAWRGTTAFSFTSNRPPLVSAGPDRTITLPQTASLAGAASDDGFPAPGTLAVKWSLVSGGGTVVFSDPTAVATTASFAAPGTYVLRLTAHDGRLRASDDVVVTVGESNDPPSVNAGPDRSVSLAAPTASLAGSVSDDGRPSGGSLTVLWSVVSGPASVTFSSASTPQTTATFGQAGVYVLRLTASDTLASAHDEVTVTVAAVNRPPLVNAGSDQAIQLPLSATLAGQVSDDGLPSGILDISWTQTSGPGTTTFASPSLPQTSATFSLPGRYTLRLSASDGSLAASDETVVLVGSPGLLADLQVTHVDASALTVDPHTLSVTGTVAAQIANSGAGPAIGPFTVLFFEDRDVNAAYDPGTDLLLGTGEETGLDAGASTSVGATVSGQITFAGNLVMAFVDSGQAVAETDETNNYGSSAAACDVQPSVGVWSPQLEWAWTSSPVLPESNIVYMGGSAVMDLDGDRLPEVVFITHAFGGLFGYTAGGTLRAVRGKDGSELFTVTDPAYQDLESGTAPAVGDIDGDGRPEIVASAQYATQQLVAFEHDGTPKWKSDVLEPFAWGAIALADLDGDGTGEIVIGRQVLNHDGTLRWTGTGGTGNSRGRGSRSIVVDLDDDGRPEVLAGNTAYRGSGPDAGQVFWQNTDVPDGFTAVANFDADPAPEIVLVAEGKVWLLEHDGSVVWGPVDIPGLEAYSGSMPSIGDVDGDGGLEIVAKGNYRVAVFEADGTLKWSAPFIETPGWVLNYEVAPQVLFDFDGDGAAEVVVSELRRTRIHRGSDGAILAELPFPSAQGFSVVDVDGDGNAEIVGGDRAAAGNDFAGLSAWGDASDLWMATRPVWNQASYHITNVNDDGTLPRTETPSWEALNAYHQSALVSVVDGAPEAGCPYAKPDLVPSYFRSEATAGTRTLTVRVGNGGTALAGSGVAVSFYDGDPRGTGVLVGTAFTTARLLPGRFEDVSLNVEAALTTAASVWVMADDRGSLVGGVTESDETNNLYDSSVALLAGAGGSDLVVVSIDASGITGTATTLEVGGQAGAVVRNQGSSPAAGPFHTTFFDDRNGNGMFDAGTDLVLGVATLGGLAPQASATVTAAVSGTQLFRGRPIHAFVDSGSTVVETSETNNVGVSGESCRSRPGPPYSPVVERSWTGSSVPGLDNVYATPVVTDLDADGVADVAFNAAPASLAGTLGQLSAISGRTGAELFTVTDPNVLLDPRAALATGDIDADGRPEILAMAYPTRVVAFEHDGSVKWESAFLEQVSYLGVTLADLDGDGQTEVLAGRHVLNANGTPRWEASGFTYGWNASGASATVADLDGLGPAEVLLGNTAYRADGSVFWTNPSLPDGITATANFDDDPFPEIVHVATNEVRLLDHLGQIVWGPVTVPGGGYASSPAIADFDGDGALEIAVSAGGQVSLIETLGMLRWTVPVDQATAIWSTGPLPSAFDFDGDGSAEVVFSDEAGLHVRGGRDGESLAQIPLDTCNVGQAYPLVADVDGDANAEIVTVSNATCPGSHRNGLFIVGEAGDRWVTARPLWNQYGYRVSNVEDDGTIPRKEGPPRPRARGHRLQASGEGSAFASPDLTASYVRQGHSGPDIVFTVRIGNAGAAIAPAAVPVSFFNGDPRLGFAFVGTTWTSVPLEPGEFEDVVFTTPSATAGDDPVHVMADADASRTSTVSECNEEDNLVNSGFYLNRAPTVDLGPDRTLPPGALTATLSATVDDDGFPTGQSLTVTWNENGDPNNPRVAFGDLNSNTTVATFAGPGVHHLRLYATDGARTTIGHLFVTVVAGNTAPVVDAGPDKVVVAPADSVLLEGTVSDDGLPLGSTLAFSWTKVEGPSTVVFDTPVSPALVAHFGGTGRYVLRLTATDGERTSSDDVVVHVDPANQAPTVSAGQDRSVPTTTALAGSVSDDGFPRGSVLGIAWSVVSGPGSVVFANPASLTTTVTFGANGLYTLRLTATDGEATASDDVVLNVNPPNQAPVVSAGGDQTISRPPTSSATLAGTASDDGLPSGTVSTLWTQVSGPSSVLFANPAQVTTSATFSTIGVFVLRLAASDGALSASDEVTVAVVQGNDAPTVAAGPDASLTLPVSTLSLSGAVTDDGLPTPPALAVLWSKTSGPGDVLFANLSSPATQASFTAVGTYTLRLTATDGALSAFDELTVTVLAAAPVGEPPVVEIASPEETAAVLSPIDVMGSVSSDHLFRWRLEHRLQGDDGFAPLASGTTNVANGVLGRLDPTRLLNGLHEIRLTATDTAGRSTSTSRFVVVRENQKVGHFTVSFVDLEVPVAGLPIRVTRTYDSREKGKGDFGFGWRLDVSSVRLHENTTAGLSWFGMNTGIFAPYCLVPVHPSVVTVTLPDGRVQEFEAAPSRQCQSFVPLEETDILYRPRPGTLGSLEPVDGGRVLIVGSWPGPLQLFNATTYRLFDPQVYRYTGPDGRQFLVEQGVGLKSLTDRNGNRLSITAGGITYDNPSVPGSTKGVVFTRDAEGRITRVTDPSGRFMTYAYDANGDLQTFTDREENATAFAYEPSLPHHLRDIRDPLGRTPIRNEYYEDGLLKSHTDAFNKTITYSHDLATLQEVVTDRTGAVRVLEFDDRGNVTKETQPDGKIIRRTFDLRNNRLSETEPHDPATLNPPATTYTYDDQENLLTSKDPLGNETKYTYNAQKQVLTTTDARNKTTTNVYDGTGNLTKATDAAGTETIYTYDTQGNVLTQTVTVAGIPHVTGYDYDFFGHLEKETDALGHDTSYTYDASGNRLTQTTTRTTPSGSETLTTTFAYDDMGRLTRTTDPDASYTETTYDELGRQRTTRDKLGRIVSYDYDEMGRLTKTTHPDLTTDESTYDAEGRRLTSKDRGGRTTTYEYDSLGRLKKTIYADSTFTENTYDPAGRLAATKDARGKSTTYEYDTAGRRTKVRDPLGNETVFTYDGNGNQKTVKDARGNIVTYEYDDLNRRTRTIFPSADGIAPTTFTQTGYDALGRRTTETDQAGKTTTFAYDKLGRLTKVTDALSQDTTYQYDELGNRTRQTDAKGHATRFEFDKLGRQTSRILPDGKTEMMAYDAAGNLRTRTDFMGRVTTYDYDQNNRLTGRTYPSAAENVGFTYTPTGRRLTATDSRGTTTYGYDLRDRLTSLVQPGVGSLTYTYDGNGNRLSLGATIGADTHTTSYTYDDASRLDIVTDPLGRTYDHGYDPNGNRTRLTQPNGAVTAYAYDNLNRLTNLGTTIPSLSRTIQSYSFTLGPAGNRTRITEHDGTVRDYAYDALYRLTGDKVTEAIGLVYEKTFSYDPVGNRQTQTTALGPAGVPGPVLQPGTITYGYDDRDRLLLEGAQTFIWDDNGNLTTKDSEAVYTWNHENRLTRVANTDGTVVEHVYDADGNRVQTKTTPPSTLSVTSEFLVDTSGTLSHVVAETDGATGSLEAVYVRGDDLLAVVRATGPDTWTSRFAHLDGVGSLRRLTEEAGSITDSWSYTAFGELYGRTGSDRIPYAFAGEPLDPNSGFQYHRARWMDPRTGRFAGLDPFLGLPHDPSTLHRYLYAATNPIGNIDPTGESFTAVQTLAVGIMIGIIAAQVVPAASFEERVRLTAVGALLGAMGAGLAAGATAGGIIVTLAGSSAWLFPPLIRGRLIERGLGANLPWNYPVIDRWWNGVATSIKSIDLMAKTYQSGPALTSTIRGYIDAVAQWRGSGPWSWQPAIPGALVTGRELVLAIPTGATQAQGVILAQMQVYAASQQVQLITVVVH